MKKINITLKDFLKTYTAISNNFIDEYYNFNVDIKYFYNENLKSKIFKFYENDFIFFNNFGFDYINTEL